ncbi:MAG: 50S ribosomal protein L11 methyltransferase [Pseudomonadota bacterium]
MSYSDVNRHRSMVFDAVRNRAYMNALAKVIGPQSTVMDVGAGLGVLGLAAAQLGAAEVHLVEPALPATLLADIAKDNHLTRVHCHQAQVESLTLEVQADVLVSVLTGNFLLTEDLLPTLLLARDRFLAAGGVLLPGAARMLVMPVQAQAYYERHIECWRSSSQWFGEHALPALNYDRVAQFSTNSLFYDKHRKIDSVALAPATRLLELDFYTAQSAACDHQLECTVTSDGLCHGWLGWFQAKLGEDWFSTGPFDENTHWNQVFLPLAQPIAVKQGETLRFSLKRPEFGDWTWTTGYKGVEQRASTFLAQPQSLTDYKRFALSAKPELDARGRAMLWLLEKMDGSNTIDELTRALFKTFPALFASERQAQQFVREAIARGV